MALMIQRKTDTSTDNAELRLAGLVHDSITDGPGLRMVVFTQGCPHHCIGCHNPHTWAFESGTVSSSDDLIYELEKNPLTKGVTLSGGEPFVQARKLLAFAKAVKAKGLELAAYSGFLFEEIIEDKNMLLLLKECDILVDGRFDLQLKSLGLKFKGSSNQRVIDVKESLIKGKAVLTTDKRWV